MTPKGKATLVNLPMRDRLYIRFIMGMSAYHYGKFMNDISEARREYLFSLWVKRNYGELEG